MPVLEISQLSLRYADLRIQDPSRRTRLAASIAQRGQLSPVLVHAAEEQLVLVDGYARVGALRELGRDLVDALTLESSGSDALLVAYRLQGCRRRSGLEEGWLLRSLIDEHGVRACELATMLERSRSWVSRHLALVAILPESVQAAVRRAEISPKAAMRALVPLARANVEHCERLVAALSGEMTSGRELEQIYRAWRVADPIVRERIIDHPQLFLRTAQAQDVATAKEISAKFRALEKLSLELSARLREASVVDEIPSVGEAWSLACAAHETLRSQMDALYARPRHPEGDSPTSREGARQACHRADPPHLEEQRPPRPR